MMVVATAINLDCRIICTSKRLDATPATLVIPLGAKTLFFT
jgi:hypothetical protein